MNPSGEVASRPPRSRWKQRLLALCIGWVVLEIAVLPYVGALLPLSVRARLPAPMYILGERSKSGFLPRDWILVLGDSYAEGQGDWLTSALTQSGSPPFQATDVLHALSGRDVLNFGSGGANSVSSTAFTVEKRFAALARTGLSEPTDVLVYFYEGNDLVDNLVQAKRRFDLERIGIEKLDDAALDRGIETRARAGFWSGLGGNLLLPYVLSDVLSGATHGGMHNAELSQVKQLEGNSGQLPNRFASGGAHYAIDGVARGPGLELSAEETDLALRMLDRSLDWTERRFASARIHVVYLPSPLTCYALESDEVRTRVRDTAESCVHPSSEVTSRSDAIRARVRGFATARKLGFIDATDDLRAAAHVELVHGPKDAGHFNRKGYTVLGELLARELGAKTAASR